MREERKAGFTPMEVAASSSLVRVSTTKTTIRRLRRHVWSQPCFSMLLVVVMVSILYYYNNNNSTESVSSSTAIIGRRVSIQLVTYNIAGLGPSEMAPIEWKGNTAASLATEAITSEILANLLPPEEEEEEDKLSVVALQECPSEQWIASNGRFLMKQGYQSMGSTPSHAGFVTLFVRDGSHTTTSTRRQQTWSSNNGGIPAVVSVVTVAFGAASSSSASLWIASVHLAPFERRSPQRYQQMLLLRNDCRDHDECDVLIVMGDMNMRDSEDDVMEKDLGYVDAWKVNGSDTRTKFTWDTTLHVQTSNSSSGGSSSSTAKGEWQNLFYGTSTRPYQERYDRVYVFLGSSPTTKPAGPEISVPKFSLIGNQPIPPSPYHFLSDHFGIAAELQLEWT